MYMQRVAKSFDQRASGLEQLSRSNAMFILFVCINDGALEIDYTPKVNQRFKRMSRAGAASVKIMFRVYRDHNF